MTDIPSVLLIVGSVLVGPVEALELPSQCPAGSTFKSHPKWEQIVTLGNGWRPATKDTMFCVADDDSIANPIFPRESIDQLCERAMREIGADPKVMGTPVIKGTKAPIMVGHMLFTGDRITCFPTPKGYRK